MQTARLWIVPRSVPDDPVWVAAYVGTVSGWGEDADHSLHPLSVEEAVSNWQEVLKSPAWLDQRNGVARKKPICLALSEADHRRPRRTGLPPPSISAGWRNWSPRTLSGSKGWQRPRNILPAQRMLHPSRTSGPSIPTNGPPTERKRTGNMPCRPRGRVPPEAFRRPASACGGGAPTQVKENRAKPSGAPIGYYFRGARDNCTSCRHIPYRLPGGRERLPRRSSPGAKFAA